MQISRRRFGVVAGGAMASLMCSPGCGFDALEGQSVEGRISARPKAGVKTTATGTQPLGLAGSQSLGLGATRDGLLQMPDVIPSGPMPLLVLLHGASGSAERQLGRMGTA